MSYGESDPGGVLTALEETGAIGSTIRQLATRTDTPTLEVGRLLERLRRDGEVLRMGRGLWILREFERLDGREDFVDPAEYVERFVAEGGVSLGAYRGPITFSPNDELPIHRWWPYVQGYSAEFVAKLLTDSNLAQGSTVLDPFAGSGTTAVESRRAGMRAIGCELLPPAALAARVKTRFDLAPEPLQTAAGRLVRSARRRDPGPPPFLRETSRQFSRAALRDLTRIRDVLPPDRRPVSEALRMAFGAILIPASRLRRSPCLGYGKPEDRNSPSPFERYEEVIRIMVEDLRGLRRREDSWGPPARILGQDARTPAAAPGSVDLAVTSPPYVNGMDYVMNYKLDLAWLGYARDYSDLARLRQAMVACDNLPRKEAARYLDWTNPPDAWLPGILENIRSNLVRKGTYRRQDVHGIVHRYFSDLAPVLQRVFEALRPGGRFVIVVGDSLLAGTYVPGDLILARMGAAIGFRIAAVDVARTRRSGQRRSFRLRESLVRLEKPRSS